MPCSSSLRNDRGSRTRSESASRLLQRGPGDLRVEQRLEFLAVGARPEQHALHQVPGLSQAAVESEARLHRELLADGRLVRVALGADARLLQIAERLTQLEPDELIRAALLRDGVLQFGLRLADARELLRKVEAALQGERDEHALLLERIVGERGRGGVGAGGVAVGAAA